MWERYKKLMAYLIIVCVLSCTTYASDENPANNDPFAAIGGWVADRGN